MGYRPVLVADPLDQQFATMKAQTGITVGHEDLRVSVVTFDKPYPTRAPFPRQHRRAVTNLPAENT